jgi:prevent-host-death family protein
MVVAPGEVEQPEPVANGERVEVQRAPLASLRAILGLVCHRLVHIPNSLAPAPLASTMLCAQRAANGLARPSTADDDQDDYDGHQEVVSMPEAPSDQAWSVADAKARLSELLDHVINDGPQAISRRGREIAVVVSTEEWHRKTARSGSLAEFFAASPLRDSELDIERVDAAPRDIAL